MHRSPVLWAFHRVHHTAECLTPFTVLRTHPVEGILFGFRSALVQGLLIGIFVFVFADRVTLISLLGGNLFISVLNLLGSNLRHSPVPISYGENFRKMAYFSCSTSNTPFSGVPNIGIRILELLLPCGIGWVRPWRMDLTHRI